MSQSKWTSVVLPGLALTAVIAAFATVGGPGQGRIEKRDDARFQAIVQISNLVICSADANARTLPQEIENHAACRAHKYPSPNDLGFDAKFNYTKIDDKNFEICADFEDLDSLTRAGYRAQDFDRDTGCLKKSYKPA